MCAFVRANSGGWVKGQTIEAAEINTIDTNQSRAVDGYAGGDYSPSSPIVLKTGDVRVQVESGALHFDAYAYPTIGTSVVTQTIALMPNYVTTNSGSNDFTFLGYCRQNYVNAAIIPEVWIPWSPVPRNGTITSLTFSWIGNDHTDVPVILPKVELYRQLYSSTTPTLLATAEDTTSNVSIYNAAHLVNETGLDVEVDSSDWDGFYFRVYGEGGANSKIYSKLLMLKITMEVTALEP